MEYGPLYRFSQWSDTKFPLLSQIWKYYCLAYLSGHISAVVDDAAKFSVRDLTKGSYSTTFPPSKKIALKASKDAFRTIGLGEKERDGCWERMDVVSGWMTWLGTDSASRVHGTRLPPIIFSRSQRLAQRCSESARSDTLTVYSLTHFKINYFGCAIICSSLW